MTSLSPDVTALFFALGSTLLFATSSLVFAEYAKRVSALWMNCFKSVICFLALMITVPIFTGWHSLSPFAFGCFLISGLIGLNLADFFLLKAFIRIGVARTLILYGFQPLMVGISAYILFRQPIGPERFLAVIFLIACLFTFSLETYRREKRWEIHGLAFALIGITLDTCGILLTREAFTQNPLVTPLEGHFWRCVGALIGFAAMACFWRLPLIDGIKRWNPRTRAVILTACLAGTFFSILLYLTALKIGHLASISAIAITGPMFATALESLIHRKKPSPYLMVAIGFFCVGFYILLKAAT